MRRNSALRYDFLARVRLCTLPSKSLARLDFLASAPFDTLTDDLLKKSKWWGQVRDERRLSPEILS